MHSHVGGHLNRTHVDIGVFQYLQRKPFKSMIDIGCGPGGMETIAIQHGVSWTGVDGDETVIRPGVVYHDYTKGPLVLPAADLAWSVEFVEHVEEQYVPNFMATFSCCQRAFITAAPPGAPGWHHVNCRDAAYWIEVFRQAGFEFDPDGSVDLKWHSTMIKPFVQRSGMLFRRA